MQQKDPEWEGARRPATRKLYKKRGRPPKTPAAIARAAAAATPSTTPESRTRPSNLRQRPVKKYTQFVEDDEPEDENLVGIVSSDEDGNPLPPLNKKRKRRLEEDTDDLPDEPAPEESSVEDATAEGVSATSSAAPSLDGSLTPLSRAQMKNPRLRKGGKRKHVCELCGKCFSQVSALNGHMAVHTKEKLKVSGSHESSPTPSNKCSNDSSPSVTQETGQTAENAAQLDENSSSSDHNSLPIETNSAKFENNSDSAQANSYSLETNCPTKSTKDTSIEDSHKTETNASLHSCNSLNTLDHKSISTNVTSAVSSSDGAISNGKCPETPNEFATQVKLDKTVNTTDSEHNSISTEKQSKQNSSECMDTSQVNDSFATKSVASPVTNNEVVNDRLSSVSFPSFNSSEDINELQSSESNSGCKLLSLGGPPLKKMKLNEDSSIGDRTHFNGHVGNDEPFCSQEQNSNETCDSSMDALNTTAEGSASSKEPLASSASTEGVEGGVDSNICSSNDSETLSSVPDNLSSNSVSTASLDVDTNVKNSAKELGDTSPPGNDSTKENQTNCDELKSCNNSTRDCESKESHAEVAVSVKEEPLEDESLAVVVKDENTIKQDLEDDTKMEIKEDDVEHDPSPYLPDPEAFQLMATSVEELR